MTPGLPGILNSTNNPPEGPGSSGKLTIDVDAQVMEFTQPHLVMGESTSVVLSTFADEGTSRFCITGPLIHGSR